MHINFYQPDFQSICRKLLNQKPLSILTSLKCNEISCCNKLSVENFNCVIFDSDVYLFCTQIWKFMCIMHQRAWYVHRCIILNDRSLTQKTQSVWVLMTRDAYSQMYNVTYMFIKYQMKMISLRFFLQGEDIYASIGSYQDVLKSNHWSTLFFK